MTVVVETFRECDGALLVATARGGSGIARSAASPFAFQRAPDGSFVACLSDGPAGGGGGAVLVLVEGASVRAAWVGALEAIVLRHGEVVHRTAPQLLSLEVAASLGIASPRQEPGVDLAGPWPTEPGDLVLMCSAKVLALLSADDVAALASRDDIAIIVRGLVTTASTRAEVVDLCAMAIRIVAT